jgi:hypothetical protein
MTLFDSAGRPVVRRDTTPAAPTGPFVLTLSDPDLALARVLTDNAVVQQALAAGIVELVGRQFGTGAASADKRKRGLVPAFLAGEQKYLLNGAGTRSTISAPIDSATSNAQGSVLYRGQSIWLARGPSSANFLLKTLGANADPVWAISPGAIPLRARFIVGAGTDTTDFFGVLAGTSYLDLILVGSGGGAGQANASSAGNLSIGSAGGGGSACRHIIAAPAAGYLYTLGAWGGNAQQGAQSTVTAAAGVILTAPGGGAGATTGSSNTLTLSGNAGGASTASGGSVWNRGGKPAGPTIRFSGSVGLTGRGGASPGWGTGGNSRVTSGVGEVGHGYGGGGSGGLAINGAGAQVGGHGAPALLVVVEYASAT